GQTDTDFGQPPAIAGNVDRVTRKLWVCFQESTGDLAGCHADRLIDLHIVRRDLHSGPCCAHQTEICFRRKAGACAVPVPFVEDQTRTRHMSSMSSTIARARRGAGTWQSDGKPRSYCGQKPWTTKANGRPEHWRSRV